MQEIIPVNGTIPLLQFFLIGRYGLVAKQRGQTKRKGIEVLRKTLPILLPQTIRAKVDVDIEIRYGSAQHAAVFAVDRTPFSIHFNELLVQAVTEAPPVGALNALDIERLTQHHQAQDRDADEA